VIGVILGHDLNSVTSVTGADSSPHCSWDDSKFAPLMQEPDPVQATAAFVKSHALMCLAAQYSEACECEIKSDEQTEARHYDYLDAQRMKYYCHKQYFGTSTEIPNLCDEAKALVEKHNAAIVAVAEQLRVVASLDHDQIQALIDANPPPPPAAAAAAPVP
jgi:hypothetical protein